MVTPGTTTRRQRGSKEEKTDAIIIKNRIKPYAEVLRDMETQVKLDSTRINIVQIRRTNRGHMLITLKKKRKADQLRSTISTNMKDLKVVVKEASGRRFDIHDLDAVTTQEEVESALKDMASSEEERRNIKLFSIRPAFGDTQKSTVILPKKLLEDITQKVVIKIGWMTCRVRERVEQIRCFRCLATRHLQTRCNEPDRRKNCLWCGEEGHIAKTCRVEAYCPICKPKE